MTAMWLAPQVIICPLPSPLTAIMQYFCGLFGHTLQHQLQCLPVSSWWRRIQSCSHRITQKMTWYVCGLWPPISLKKTLILVFFSNKICNIFLVAFIWIMQRMTLPGNFFMLYNGYFLDNSNFHKFWNISNANLWKYLSESYRRWLCHVWIFHAIQKIW